MAELVALRGHWEWLIQALSWDRFRLSCPAFSLTELKSIMKHSWTNILFAGLVTLPLVCRAERLPNVVVMFCDDMGYADIGSFGAKGYSTPNLDRMAR